MNMQREKLLFLGNSIGTEDAIYYAKSLGIETILTDYLPLEENPLKLLTDSYWMIDLKDLDALEARCCREKVTAIFAATGEFSLEQARKLCRRLGLPFYASEEGERAARDKGYFKKNCDACGLLTPEEYEPENVVYPVVIKPVDSCAQQGLSLCWRKEELPKALEFAKSKSPAHRVVIEEYVEGDELWAYYVFCHEKPYLLALSDIIHRSINGRNNFDYAAFDSRFCGEYRENIEPKVIQLFERLNCRKGVILLQMIRKNGKYFLLEMGYRLDAVGSWRVLKRLTGCSSLEWQVLLAMGREPEKVIPTPKPLQEQTEKGAVYFVWGKPGTVASLEGEDAVSQMEGTGIFTKNIRIGKNISVENNMHQIMYTISILGPDKESISSRISAIKEVLHAYDASGQELLCHKKEDILLILGNSFGTMEAIKYARSLGVKTIVTDYFSLEKNQAKTVADAYWMIDIKDLDLLEKKCRKEGVTAIFAATGEFCLDQVKALCARLGLPFYASEKGWMASRDKGYFKECCQKCGIKTPQNCVLDRTADRILPDGMTYPVIVKPIDSSGQQGISICRGEEEFTKGFEKAIARSSKEKIIVEEYIEGEEVGAQYYIFDGSCVLLDVADLQKMDIQGKRNFTFLSLTCRFYNEYVKNVHPIIEKLLSYMECRQGMVTLQAIRRAEDWYFFEMGYRLETSGDWEMVKKETGYNSLERMVDAALGRKPSVEDFSLLSINPDKNLLGIYFMWARPGKIARIIGLEELEAQEGIQLGGQVYREGDVILPSNDMRQIVFYINIIAENDQEMVRKLEWINTHLHIYSEENEELLLYFWDYIPSRPGEMCNADSHDQ